MSDDIWSGLKALAQERRKSNTAASTRLLTEAGIPFASLNNGAHLKLTKGDLTIDYWPSTGLWIVKGYPEKRRGVRNLIQFLKEN